MHGMRPSLLDAIAAEGLGAFATPELRTWSTRHAAHCLALSAELVQVVGSLDRAGIVAMPFKGPVLGLGAYGDLAAREYLDLDVMVPRNRVPEARDRLLASGYRGGLDSTLPPRREARYVRTNHQHPMSGDDGSLVEIQWGLAPRHVCIEVDTDAMIERAMPATLAGHSLRVPTPEDDVIIICVNGAKDAWSRLSMVNDLAHAIDREPGLDWRQVQRLARRGRVQRMVAAGLALVSSVAGDRLPPIPESAMRVDADLARVVRRFERRLFDPAGPPPKPAEASGLDPGFRVLIDRGVDRWRAPVRRVVTPTEEDWAWLDLPAWLEPAYYVVRPARVVRRRFEARR